MEKNNRSLLTRAQDLVGEAEDLAYALSKSEGRHRDEVQRLTLALAQTANEVDRLKREGANTAREELAKVRAMLLDSQQRHLGEIVALREENAKLREAKNKAFRQLADQQIVAKAVEQYREANLKLLRERDSARSERDAHAQSIHLLSAEVTELTRGRDGWRFTAEEMDRDRVRIQSDLTAQEQENDRLGAEIERLKNQPASNGRTDPARSEGAWVVRYDVPQEYWTGSHSDTAKNGDTYWSSDINRAQRWGTHPDWWSGAGQAVFIPGLSVERGAK